MFNIKNIHHIEITVSDIKRSKEFYLRLPGFKIVAEYANFVMFNNGFFYFGLTDHKGKQDTTIFSEKNVGLDHVSFCVASKKDLDNAIVFFDKENIKHGRINKLSNNLHVLAFRDPDNIQLELSWKDYD